LATQASAQAAAPDPVEADPVEAEPVEAEPVEAEPVAPERPEAKKQAPATPADETAPPEPAQEKKKTNKKPKQSKAGVPWLGFGSKNLGEVEVHGRIFARAAFSSRYVVTSESTGVSHEERVDSLDFSIPSARAELFYRAPFRWFSADIEVELADEPELRDAWLRAKNRHFAAKLGQFKAPFSAIELESRWNLPVASRGLLHDILVDELEVAGRRPGFTLGARTAGALDLSLTLGAFQGSVLVERDENGRDVDPLFEQGMRSQSLFVRTELSFDDLSLGLGYEHRVGTPDVLYIEHYPTFGADAVLDTRVLGRGLRIWLEGMVGGSWFEHARKPSDDRNAVFTAGRVVIAPRIGGNSRHAPYLEPYGMLGLFDPDTEVAQDLAFEESLGVNAGFWRLVRLGLEFELWRVQRNFPVSYGLGKNPDRLALLLQGGAEF
jgi:hypothetical protein